jgi:uncharacterized protein (DUF2252 family)
MQLRFAVLLSVGTSPRAENYCLVDIKEAVPAAAPRATGVSMPRDNGRRVVEGAMQLAPALGERMLAAHLVDRSVFLRELIP